MKGETPMHFRTTAVAAMLALAAGAAWSHGGSHEKKAAAKPAQVKVEEQAFGRLGDLKEVTRTINVGMDDSMHFSSGDIVIKRGETVRFVVHNDGLAMHEMVIGTMKELKEHADLMRKFPDMEHDEPYMAHVAPGKLDEIVWQFTRPGEFYYACLIPGHLEAGMIAKIKVE
jgi:uncharacterized cupredoxin-like copper-binding protein